MKSLIKKRIYRISAVIVTLLVCIAAVFVGNVNTTAVYADSDTVASYENQNVLDDLEGSIIAGVEFDLADYPYDENGQPQVLNFVEFGYSIFSNNQDDYNLYIYVYNPTGYAITDSSNNKIEFEYASGNNVASYSLEMLNYSTKSGYEGLFYKFKITLSDSQRSAILKAQSQSSRVYSISGITLWINSSLVEYEVGGTYTYSGYALGYGSTTATESSLTCTVDGFDRYINLDVQQTVYYPEGDYYNGEQVQLNSCYFGVPNNYLNDYGTLTSVFAEWYEYLTKPILVTQNEDVYTALSSLHGGSISSMSGTYDNYFLVGYGNVSTILWVLRSSDVLCWASNNYDSFLNNTSRTSFNLGSTYYGFSDGDLSEESYFDNFAAIFYTGSNKSYSDYSVSSEDLQSVFLANSAYLAENGYSLDIVDKYSGYLFEDYIDSTGNTTEHVRGYNSLSISVDDVFEVYANHTTKEWWQYIFGGYEVTTDWDEVKAIVEVSYSDISSMSAADIADTYYINKNDVSDFKSYVKTANANDETVYIMRYGCANYSSFPAIELYNNASADENCGMNCLLFQSASYNAYVCKETVYLNFDIISLTFTADDVDTVIAVVMSPQDVFSDTNPPLEEVGSNCEQFSWTTILGILLLVLLLIICWPFLPYIAKFIVWVISLPFKLIGAIYKAIKKRRNKDSTNENKKE